MSTELACFSIGIAATILWLGGIRKGVMPGWKILLFAAGTGLVRSSVDALSFWIVTMVVGCLALGLLVLPVLSWIGVRR